MKGLLKGFLRRFGLDLVRHAPDTLAPPDLLRLAIEHRLTTDDRFFFIQVGANDGRRDDPIHDLVKARGLAGLLVEPLPAYHAALREHYADCPALRFEQAAIAPVSGEAPMYHFDETADVPDWAHGLASLDRGRLEAESAKHGWSGTIVETVIPTITFRDLLEKHGVDGVSLLLIDTEGFDYEVLSMALEAGLRPDIVQYEFLHLRPDDRIAAKRRLIAAGYGVVDLEIDTLALREAQ